MNAYHPKIKFTVEKDLTKFLDTRLELEEGKYTTSVNRNRKLPTHWTSKIPKKIKRNIITNDLHRARKISSNFNDEVKEIKVKYEKARYPPRFVDSIIKDFKEKQSSVRDSPEEQKDKKPLVLLRIPFCEKNEKTARHFLVKLQEFTGNNYRFSILWQMKKIKTLFKLKDEVKHKANVVYKGTSVNNPEETYIGETAQLSTERWNQHENPSHVSAPSKFLQENENDRFNWEILTSTSSNWLKRKIHEALFICKYKPTLNKQVDHKRLLLFRNGVT